MAHRAERNLLRQGERTMADYLRPRLGNLYPPCAEQTPESLTEKLGQLSALTDVRPHQRSGR